MSHWHALSRWRDRIVRLLALACLSLLSIRLPAAISYGQDSGLPNLSVQVLVQDSAGLIWVGTEDGLVRFDGHRFLRLPLENAPGQTDANVMALLPVPGAVLVAARERLFEIRLGDLVFRELRAASGPLSALQTLARTADGRIYAAGNTSQLWTWKPGDLPESIALPAPLAAGGVRGLSPRPDGVWLAGADGVWWFDLQTREFSPLAVREPGLKGGRLMAQSVLQVADVLWIGWWNDGLLRLDLRTREERWFHPRQPGAGALRSTSIYTLAAGQAGKIYIGSNRGLVVYRPDCDCLRGLNLPAWNAADGVGVIINSLLPQDDGVWAGVWGGGAVRFSALDEVFQQQVVVQDRNDRLARPMVRALVVDARQRLYIGSIGGGVQWVDAAQRRDGEPWPLQSLPWTDPVVESKFVWSLQPDPPGLQIGTGNGAFVFDHASGTTQLLAPRVESLRCALVSSSGRRLFGSVRGLFESRAGVLEPVALVAPDGLPTPLPIWSMAEQGDQIWLGTARGLVRLDAQLRVLGQHVAGTEASQLPGTVVWSQRRDAAGQLWLATSGGLAAVGGSTMQPLFESHRPQLEAVASGVFSIEPVADGSLWLGTPNGLVHYQPGTGKARRFDHRDGLLSAQFNPNASASDGRLLYFGTVSGLVAFDPTAVSSRQLRLRPGLTRLRQGNGNWQQVSGVLELPYGHAPLQLEFHALAYSRPEAVRYAYRWRGQETEFTDLGEAQSAVLTYLPAGPHTLELLARSTDPPASASAAVLDVMVAPPWYQTTAGRVLLLGLLVLAVSMLLRWRSWRERVHARELETEVAQRTAEISRMAEALARANARLETLAARDPLTGLANRRGLFATAAAWFQSGRALSALLLDLDHFKRINDERGHDQGDRVLIDFAMMLTGVCARGELCARYGGEEFLVLVPDADHAELIALAERILSATRARELSSDSPMPLRYTVSIGCAYAAGDTSVEALIRRADRAVYAAKAQGRDRWVEG